MERDEKQRIRLRYAVGLSNAFKKSKYKSFRELALNTGFEPSHIQRIAAGKVDVVLTTAIALAEGLGLSPSELFAFYEAATEKEIAEFVAAQQVRKRTPSLKSKSAKPKKKKK